MMCQTIHGFYVGQISTASMLKEEWIRKNSLLGLSSVARIQGILAWNI
jgi:hypothetical protein